MNEEDELPISAGSASTRDRIAAFQMLDAMGETTQARKTYRLALVGFTRQDIASMLQISVASVSQNIYTERGKGKKPAKKA